MKRKENKLSFIELLRAVAVILITNSHLKGVYPSDMIYFLSVEDWAWGCFI